MLALVKIRVIEDCFSYIQCNMILANYKGVGLTA